MVNWQGLLKWSLTISGDEDRTKPSEFREMKKEDKEWLEAAMKAYTFNDTERMKEVIELLKS